LCSDSYAFSYTYSYTSTLCRQVSRPTYLEYTYDSTLLCCPVRQVPLNYMQVSDYVGTNACAVTAHICLPGYSRLTYVQVSLGIYGSSRCRYSSRGCLDESPESGQPDIFWCTGRRRLPEMSFSPATYLFYRHQVPKSGLSNRGSYHKACRVSKSIARTGWQCYEPRIFLSGRLI
jgi:hypothetical protein